MCFQRICRGADRNRRGGVSGRLPHTRSPFPRCTRLRTETPPRGVRGNRALRAAPQGTAVRRPQGAKRGRLAASLHAAPSFSGGMRAHGRRQSGRMPGALQSLASAAAAVKRYQRLPEAESSSCSSGSAAEGGCGCRFAFKILAAIVLERLLQEPVFTDAPGSGGRVGGRGIAHGKHQGATGMLLQAD